MEEITLESIRDKLGFDPLNPPARKIEPYAVIDYEPSIWEPLSEEELAYLVKIKTGIDLINKTGLS